MKVLVVNNAVPFLRGGAEELADHLVRQLNATSGVAAELVRIPFRWEPAERIVDEVLLNRSLRLYNVDRVIGLKFPAYLVPHTNKVLWLLHQFRQAYDLYESHSSYLCSDPNAKSLLELVRNADNQCFSRCKSVFTNSPVTQARLKRFNNFDGTVLYPPLNDPEQFQGGDYGDYIFAGGRVGAGKRQHLLIEAMRHVRQNIRLVIAGPPDDITYQAKLEKQIVEYDLGQKVQLRFGFRDRAEIGELVNGSLACAYLPFDEDSLGYVTMEAFAAAKAVVTTQDSGGLLEIVRHDETGYVVDPDPNAIALTFDKLARERATAQKVGRAARALLSDKRITWRTTIDQLLA